MGARSAAGSASREAAATREPARGREARRLGETAAARAHRRVWETPARSRPVSGSVPPGNEAGRTAKAGSVPLRRYLLRWGLVLQRELEQRGGEGRVGHQRHGGSGAEDSWGEEEFPEGSPAAVRRKPLAGSGAAAGLTLLPSDGPVEQGVEQQLEGSRISQAVEDLEDVGLGEEPFPAIQRLKNPKKQRVRSKTPRFEASPPR